LLGAGPLIAFDHPGFGESDDFADGRHSLERSVELAQAVLDTLAVPGPVDVVGHSHGALVALALAAMAPDRCARALLLASGGSPAHSAYRLLRVVGVEQGLGFLARHAFRSPWGERFMVRAITLGVQQGARPDVLPAAGVDEEVDLFRRRPSSLITMARQASDDPCGKCALLAPSIRAPIWFVHGRDDALVPLANARRLQRLVPGSRFFEVEGGHLVHLSHPERLSDLIASWRLS
jgi:pimeloyl-ACP methyl ester carboxylesterase